MCVLVCARWTSMSQRLSRVFQKSVGEMFYCCIVSAVSVYVSVCVFSIKKEIVKHRKRRGKVIFFLAFGHKSQEAIWNLSCSLLLSLFLSFLTLSHSILVYFICVMCKSICVAKVNRVENNI